MNIRTLMAFLMLAGVYTSVVVPANSLAEACAMNAASAAELRRAILAEEETNTRLDQKCATDCQCLLDD